MAVPIEEHFEEGSYHYHHPKPNLAVRCYHVCKHRVPWVWVLVTWVVSQTLTFPLEHFLWEKVWGFKMITEWLGL
jgi:hypothetical protein